MIFPCHRNLENSILQSLHSTQVNTSWTIQHSKTRFKSFNDTMKEDLEDFTWHHTTRTPHVCKFSHKLRTLEKTNRKYKQEILTYQWFILTQVTWIKLLVKENTGSRWELNLRIRLQLRWTCQKKVSQESGQEFCWRVSVPERRRNTGGGENVEVQRRGATRGESNRATLRVWSQLPIWLARRASSCHALRERRCSLSSPQGNAFSTRQPNQGPEPEPLGSEPEVLEFARPPNSVPLGPTSRAWCPSPVLSVRQPEHLLHYHWSKIIPIILYSKFYLLVLVHTGYVPSNHSIYIIYSN